MAEYEKKMKKEPQMWPGKNRMHIKKCMIALILKQISPDKAFSSAFFIQKNPL